jgi:chromosome segregation ATPase
LNPCRVCLSLPAANDCTFKEKVAFGIIFDLLKVIYQPTKPMKKSLLIIASAVSITLSGCTDTKKVTEIQDQVRRLESQVLKERQENAELSSFRFSLESQFKKKSEDYVKCQEDSKETFESLSIKYNRLLDDYNKLQASYKSLNETYEASKENSTRVIAELEERMRQIRTAKGKRYARRD